MTMTSVVVGPGSLSAPTNMIDSKRYHLQQGLSPSSIKGYETLSKGKKSWSVRLGLSRQSHSGDDSAKGWGTISGGSIISRQMMYGDPWLYGTVRSGHDPRTFLGPIAPPGAPVLVVCSCPEFLSGTTRKLGNCKKCGGHRLAGIPFGGTCRIPSTPARARPSLAGMLRPTVDDPYDLMRRNRLEQRSRARSTSPHRQAASRDSRSQSVIARNLKDWKNPEPVSRTEWFDTEPNFEEPKEKSPPRDSEWTDNPKPEDPRSVPGRLVRVPKKPKAGSWQDTSVEDKWQEVTADTRKSILECDVNPYLLVKKQSKDEDNLSDDLSDNALEHEDPPPSSLFDPSKVKSIERIPKRSGVAAIGGQRIRVFNEPREISDEDEPPTRIPIPKVSPKRPPRRLKETKAVLKSILKRGKNHEPKRKNVLFNVDNVIFAPEKPIDMTPSRKTSKSSINSFKEEEPHQEPPTFEEDHLKPPPKFISIPNIRDFKKQPERSKVSKPTPLAQKVKIDKFVPSKKELSSEVKEEMKVKVDRSEKAEVLPKKSKEREMEEAGSRVPNIAVDEKELILKTEGKVRCPSLIRSQSERTVSRPEITVEDVSFADTMRLSLSRRTKDALDPKAPSVPILRIDEKKTSEKVEPGLEKPSTQPFRNLDHFRKMRPTSWSPPPGKSRHRERLASDPKDKVIPRPESTAPARNSLSEDLTSKSIWKPQISSASSCSKIEICPESREKNICKITVSPVTSPLVHRLHVNSDTGSSRTSIIINGEGQMAESENKVTISVGGESSSCNPTVIAVNSEESKPVSSPQENRTLVILENYKSNIVIESKNSKAAEDQVSLKADETESTKKKTTQGSKGKSERKDSKLSALANEEILSKLLEESVRKARDGQILDANSGKAILKILKQSLLKSSESSETEPYLKPSDKSEEEFVPANLFLEENPYEVIKEPIYEEIPDEPPPLPLSPPPTEDFIKEKIYFGDEYKDAYFKKINEGQFISSYIAGELFKKPEVELGTEYYSEYTENFFKKDAPEEKITTKFEILDFLIGSGEHSTTMDVENEVEQEEVEDTERDLEALYEQKEISLGDLSSKSSQISNVSDSSEECNLILTNTSDNLKARAVDIERTDSGVGSESSQASSGRGVGRRWRTGNTSTPGKFIDAVSQVPSGNIKVCEDCEQRLESLISDSVYPTVVCWKCLKKRAERKEIITEIVETEQKYGRDLQIILEEFYRPILRAGLLTQEQLSAIFLNAEELLEHNMVLAEKLKDAVDLAQESGDEDLLTVDVGKIFLESERMLHAFESYCTRQGSASMLLQNLEKEKDFLRIFLKESQMENTVLRRMNLNSFLMVPVQRVTKYPLLIARLLKATPSVRPDIQEAKKRLQQAQANVELHLEHMNAEAKDVTSTKLWRRISIIQNGKRSNGEQDMVNIKLRKMAVEVLEWAHEESRFVLEGRLLVAQPTDNNWRRGRTVKLAPVIAMLVTNGKPNTEFLDLSDDSPFPKQIGIKEATLLLIKEKVGRYALLREPLPLDKCIVCCENDLEDYFEIQELTSKETYVFKAEDGERTKRWCRTLQIHAQSLGAWRRRRGALPNIMICGVARD